ELAGDCGHDADRGVVVDLPLTHADLAEFALGSRANVARVMKRFEREGLVGKDGRKIVLTPRFFDPRHSVHVTQILRGDLLRPPRRSIASSPPQYRRAQQIFSACAERHTRTCAVGTVILRLGAHETSSPRALLHPRNGRTAG